jgi:MFS family permease
MSVGPVLAVCTGNWLEFYDFLAYTLFAVYIGSAFFPSRNGSLSLLLSVATFGVVFVTRPIGAVILGRFGDRAGRRPAMLLSFLLMGAGTLMLAITPPFTPIGIAAPVLVVVSRLVQGFAIGGDVGPTTAYMVEAAPAARRGLYGSFQSTTQHAAALAAALIGLGLTRLLSPAALASWGWRVAFLLGVVIVPIGLRLRYRLPETFSPPVGRSSMTDERIRLRPYAPLIICVFILMASGTIGTYVDGYLTTYALATLRLPATKAFAISVVTSLCLIVSVPLGGWLSDQRGRRPVMLTSLALLPWLIVPGFMLILRHASALTLYATVGLIAICSGISKGPTNVALTEAVPPAVRSGVVAITYAIPVTVFGGSTQFVVTWLIQRTGNALVPAWYWTGAVLLGLCAALYIPETAPRYSQPPVALRESARRGEEPSR